MTNNSAVFSTAKTRMPAVLVDTKPAVFDGCTDYGRFAMSPDGPRNFTRACVIRIPDWHPVWLNALKEMEPWQQKAAKRQMDEMIGVYALMAGARFIRPGFHPPRKIDIKIVCASGVGPDPDNVLKSVLDTLQRVRLIVDDSTKWCSWDVPLIVRGERDETVVSYEEIDHGIMVGLHLIDTTKIQPSPPDRHLSHLMRGMKARGKGKAK